MKRIVKKMDMSFRNVINIILSKTKIRDSFYFSFKKGHRFAVPRTILFDSRDPNLDDYDSDYFLGQVEKSMLNVIDYKRTYVGYKPVRGHFTLCIAFTTEKLIDALRVAKKGKMMHVIDLHTGKLLDTNG